jgi:hypothetical protein
MLTGVVPPLLIAVVDRGGYRIIALIRRNL